MIRKLFRAFFFLLVTLGSVLALLALLEGAFVLASIFKEMAAYRDTAERVHTRFDETLGWVNRPGLRMENFYGPGTDFHTNTKSFRSLTETPDHPPEGKLRVICSGDSFALGYGVGDRQTWCAGLEALDETLETINMGQGGYGIDQSYLWFLRDGLPLKPAIHIFSFIYVDFERMQEETFFGYRKPRLRWEGDRLTVAPAARLEGKSEMPWWTQKLIILHKLRSVRFLESLYRRLPGLSSDDTATRELSLRIFEEVRALNDRNGSLLVPVYLPTEMDYRPTRLDDFRRFLKEELARRGILFVDLTEDLRKLKAHELTALFLSGEDTPYIGADGHYSAAGNAFIARALYRRLEALPAWEEITKRRAPADAP